MIASMKHIENISIFIFSIFLLSCNKVGITEQTKYADEGQSYLSYTRTVSDAKELALSASSLLDSETKGMHRNVSSAICIVATDTKSSVVSDTLMYVFNYDNNEGFAIVNADVRMDPFICVTESGSFTGEGNTGNPAFDSYLEDVKEIIFMSRFVDEPLEPIDSLKFDPIPYKYKVNRYEGSFVLPLLSTKWGQQDIYGAYCPNLISGCVATAVGQIMAFHQYPSTLVTSVAMGNYAQGESISLHWYYVNSHVTIHVGNKPCTPYHSEISALLRDVGNQVGMSYNPGSSSAFSANVPNALQHYGYTAGALVDANVSTIKASLDNHRPVYMRGTSATSGHAWVADGYKDYLLYEDTYAQAYPNPGYYLVSSTLIEEVHALHINWGWNGTCNGYFNFNIYNTANAFSYDGPSGVSNNYSSGIKMIANIRH